MGDGFLKMKGWATRRVCDYECAEVEKGEGVESTYSRSRVKRSGLPE